MGPWGELQTMALRMERWGVEGSSGSRGREGSEIALVAREQGRRPAQAGHWEGG